jgi:hypothetical protein
MRLVTVKGPINDDGLQCICDLYGRHVDSRYQNLPFVRTVFNGNPLGFSYHAFVYEGEKAVGCYSVIPMEVVSRGRLMLAGKGEALFLLEDFRRGPAEGKQMLAPGLTLITEAHNFASKDGIDLFFCIAPQKLSRIFKVMGFSQLNARLNHRYFLLRPHLVRQLSPHVWKRAAASALSLAQQCSERLSWWGTSFLRPTLQIDPIFDAHRLQMIAARHAVEPHLWSVALTERSLEWWLTMNYLEVIVVDNTDSEYVLIACGGRGSNLEIVHWNIREGHILRALRVLCYIVRKARQQEAATISFANTLTDKRSLFDAAALLGFVSWPVERVMFVRSNDPFHAAPANLDFNWLFSI